MVSYNKDRLAQAKARSKELDTEQTRPHIITMNESAWLQCESVERGMFSDELAVVVSRSNGTTESYFVPVKDVERDRSRVRVALRDTGNVLWATLPTNEPVSIPVNKSRVDMK